MTTQKQHGKQIDDQIAVLTTDRDKLRDHAQKIALMIYYHAAPKEVSSEAFGFGDCTRAIKLLDVLPRSWADAMKTWFQLYSPIRVSTDGKMTGFDKKYTAKNPDGSPKLTKEEKLSWWKVDDAVANRFDTVDPKGATGVTILSLDDIFKMAAQLGKRITKIVEDEDDRRSIKPEDRETAKAFANMLNGLKIERVKAEPPANSNEDQLEEQAA